MKKNRFLFKFMLLAFVLSFCLIRVNNLFGQAVGDYGSTGVSGTPGTMDWITGTWYVCATTGTWTGATTTTTAPTSAINVWILAGDLVNLTSASVIAGKCKNLEVAGTLTLVDYHVENTQVYGNIHVASTGVINANPKFIWGNWTATPLTLTVDAGGQFYLKDQFKLYGAAGTTTTITNNGTLGASTVTVGAGATIYVINQSSAVGNSDVIFTGSGTTIFKALMSDTNAGTIKITVDQNLTFSPATASQAIKLQNSSGATATSTRTLTINAGKMVTIASGWFANNAAYSGTDASNTYNINGTLDVSAGSIYFGSTSNTTASALGTTNAQVINIGSAGILKCGTIVSVNKAQATQTLAVNVTAGGKITYAGTAYQTLPTGSIFSVTASPYALLSNTNSNVSFTNTGATNLTLNSNLTVDQTLSFGGATTLAGSGNLLVNGMLSLGGKLTASTANIALGSAASLIGTSITNYIDLSGGGSFSRKALSTASTFFPIGSGNYTPLTLTNTAGSPDVTTKVKTTFDNAVNDATKVVNLQWSVVASSNTTSDIMFQFNSGNKAASLDVAGAFNLGNYTSLWNCINAGNSSGSDPYTVLVSSLAIPASSNLYVLGNSGAVCSAAPTTTTWTGASDNNWANAANWTYQVPDNTLEAIIPASLSVYPVISASQNVKNLTMVSGAVITNNGTLNIYGKTISVNGTLAGDGAYVFVGADVQTVNGSFAVNNLTLNNISGVVNSGSITVSKQLTITAGGINGTAPAFSNDMPVLFNGSVATSAGLALTPGTGNIGTLAINGSGTLSLSTAATVKDLFLTAGTLGNSSGNITITGSVTRTSGSFSAGPIYSGSNVTVTYNGGDINAGYEVSPSSGSLGVLNINTTGTYSVVSSFTTSGTVNVQTGTLKMYVNMSVGNLIIASGASLISDNTATSTSRHTLTIGSGAADNDALITVNGTLGNGTKWSNDGIDIEVNSNVKTLTINGTGGTIGISGLRPAADGNSRALDIFINQSMNVDRDNGGASNIEPALTLQNGTCSFARTLTIASGVTVTFRGNGGLHGSKNASSSSDELVSNYASSSSQQGNCSYIINGTLDLTSISGTVFNLNTCSFTGSTQSVIVNVKNGGTLKLGNIVKMYTALASQTSDIVTESGSNVIFNTSAAQTILLSSGGGTIPSISVNNLIVNNSNGITLSKTITVKGDLTLTLGNITGSAVIMGGTTAQTITSNSNSIENLTINNAVGVSGSPSVNNTLTVLNGSLTGNPTVGTALTLINGNIVGSPSVTGTLTLTSGDVSDYSNLSNCNILFNGATAQTANTGMSSVKNLTINNTAGVTLAGAPTVNGILNLVNGKLFLDNNNLTIWSSGSVTTSSSSSYVVTSGTGSLVMSAPSATSTVFPVGTSATFNPVTVNPVNGSSFYVNVNTGNSPALPTTDATILPLKSLNRTWNIVSSAPSATTLTFGYSGGTDDANSAFDNSGADVALLHYNASNKWEYVGSGSVTPGVGVNIAKTATVDNIAAFSAFTVVNPGSGAVYVNTSGSTFSDVFRSKATGDWNGTSTWEFYDATAGTWASTVLSPGVTSTVTILSGHTVTLTTQAGVGKLIIENGATLKSSVSAYTSAPIVLSVGKASSSITNNGLLGCAKGSVAGTLGDGIGLSIAQNCVSFLLTGTGETGIGSFLAEAGSNNLVAVIDQDVQFRRATISGKQVTMSLIDPASNGFSGSRTLIINAGKTVSFLNSNACLHATSYSAAGSNTEQQGDITYDIQGILNLAGGSVNIGSSSHVSSSAQLIKLNVGKAGKLIIGGDFNMVKVQATQAVYANIEDGGLIDASASALTNSFFYGPSTNSTTGYGANFVWIVTTGNALYKRKVETGSNTKVFNVAVAPSNGNYVTITGNPVSVSTTFTGAIDVYSVNVNVGQPYPFTTFSANYAINRTWTVMPNRTSDPYSTYMKFGFELSDANSLYSTTFPATSIAGTSVSAGSTDLYIYNGTASKWTNLTWISNAVPSNTSTYGTTWQTSTYNTAGLMAPYYIILKNTGSPLICQ
jgi:hypothetical protein